MGTILGIEIESGTVLAGDRVHVEGTTQISDTVRHVFDFESAGAAAVGDVGGIDEFQRRLDADIRRYRLEHEEPMGIERLARSATPIVEATGVEAIVSTRDDESIARIRSIRRDGSVLSDAKIAFGSGAELALGQLDGIDPDGSIDEVEERVRELFSTISERDPGTGADADTWTLESSDAD